MQTWLPLYILLWHKTMKNQNENKKFDKDPLNTNLNFMTWESEDCLVNQAEYQPHDQKRFLDQDLQNINKVDTIYVRYHIVN